MIIREEKLPAAFVPPAYDVSDTLFFDIETTGLGWRSSHLYLIGALCFEEDVWILRQWFLDRPFAEKEYLQAFARFLDRHAAYRLCHFNGSTFDLPYLRNKFAFYRLPLPDLLKETAADTDLLRLIRPLKKHLPLPSLRQQAVEAFLKNDRAEQTSGKELIETYAAWLQTGDPVLLDRLFLHNHEDVLGMTAVLSLLSYKDFWNGAFSVADIEDTSEQLIFHLHSDKALPAAFSCTASRKYFPDAECTLPQLSFRQENAVLQLPTAAGEQKLFFHDYENYYYLPLEDQAVHKSVGAFVERSHRKQATAATCYRRVSGRFLPAPAACLLPLPVCGRIGKDLVLQLRAEDLTGAEPAVIRAYVLACLQTWF